MIRSAGLIHGTSSNTHLMFRFLLRPSYECSNLEVLALEACQSLP